MSRRSAKPLILIIEESLSSGDLAAHLESVGCEAAGPVLSPSDAIEVLGREAIDAAIFYIGVGNSVAEAIIAALVLRHIPFAYVSGSNRIEAIPHFHNCTTINSPFTKEAVKMMVLDLVISAT